VTDIGSIAGISLRVPRHLIDGERELPPIFLDIGNAASADRMLNAKVARTDLMGQDRTLKALWG
jgi:hypothetical protein